jgi:hypothetical protein
LEAIMKYLPFLALLWCAAGCSSEPEKSSDPAEVRRAEVKSRLNARQQELSQTETDLANVASERERVGKEEASEKKTNRLIELARLESDLKQRKASLGDEIAQLQQELGGAAPAPAAKKPEKAADALDDLLASNENKEKEDAERRKKKAEDEAAADKGRIAQAEAARKAELDEREKQKVQGGRADPAGTEGPAYEERWADVIQKVREEIQKYKRF